MRYSVDRIFLLIACFLLALLVREQTSALHKQWEKQRHKLDQKELKSAHTSSAQVMEFVGNPVKPFMADLFWIRATTLKADELFELQRDAASEGLPRIMVHSAVSRSDKDNYELYELLRQTTFLDPHFEYAYFYGAHLLAFSGKTDLALSLLHDGYRKNPDSGMIPALMAFIYFYFRKDWATGAEYAKISYENSGKYSSMYKEVANLYGAAREYSFAIEFLQDVLSTTTDPGTRTEVEEQLKYLYVEDHIEFLQKAVDKYMLANNGKPPPYIKRLVEKQIVNRIPTEPFGGRYVVTAEGVVQNDPLKRFEHYQNMREFVPERGMPIK